MNEEPLSVRGQVREFVMERAHIMGLPDVKDSQELFQSGILESLVLFRLVAYLESNFPLRISDEEIAPDNFRDIERITQFVNNKLAVKRRREQRDEMSA